MLEVASPSTEERDRDEKQDLYASIGVEEYWRFAPTGFLKDPEGASVRLAGAVLQGLGYAPSESARDGSIRSEVLGLDIRADERPETRHLVRFRDPETGQDLLTFGELQEAQIETENRLRAEAAGRREAERKAEQAQDKAERAQRKAEQAQREAERAQRDATAARRDAEVEITRLRAQVARLERSQGDGSGSVS